MRFASFVPIIALTGCMQPGALDANGPIVNSDKTLWAVTDVPQVGSILRLKYSDKKGTNVTSSSLIFTGLSARYTPQLLDIGDSEEVISATNGIKIAAGFIGKGSPNAKAELSNAATLKLKLKGMKVAQYGDLLSFQNFLRSFDGGGGAGDPTVHSLFSQINAAGNAERTEGIKTPYWVVTKVFVANNLEYSYTKKGGLKADASCGSDTKPCVVPAGALTSSIDFSSDKQNIYSGTNRPIFVVIKPVGVNSNGMIYIDDGAKGPAAISS